MERGRPVRHEDFFFEWSLDLEYELSAGYHYQCTFYLSREVAFIGRSTLITNTSPSTFALDKRTANKSPSRFVIKKVFVTSNTNI